jgi:hypothetical protein
LRGRPASLLQVGAGPGLQGNRPVEVGQGRSPVAPGAPQAGTQHVEAGVGGLVGNRPIEVRKGPVEVGEVLMADRAVQVELGAGIAPELGTAIDDELVAGGDRRTLVRSDAAVEQGDRPRPEVIPECSAATGVAVAVHGRHRRWASERADG